MSDYPQFSRRVFLGLCGLFAAQSTRPIPAQGNTGTGVLRAGIAKVDITPEPGIDIAGSMAQQVVGSIHDALHVRGLVLDSGEKSVALLTVDSCMLPKDICDKAKASIQDTTGLTPSQVLITATHTHSAPCATPVFMNNPDPAYQTLLSDRIAECVQDAVEALEPARIAWGAGHLPDEVFNRRWYMEPEGMAPNPWGAMTDKVRMNPPRQSPYLIKPAGPTDPEIPFLALQRPDGTPISLFANYALHYIGGVESGAVSADYFGVFADKLEERLSEDSDGNPVLVMLANGASGDINNIDFTAPAVPQKPYEQMDLVAEKVVQEVYAAYQQLEFQDTAVLEAHMETLRLGVRKPGEDEVAEAQAIVDTAEAGAGIQSLMEIYARETVLLDAYPDMVSVPLQVLRLGDLSIAASPCEVFVAIGLALKEAAPTPYCMPIPLANGYNGYLPTREQHALGGYETWRARSSYLVEDAADDIQARLVQMFQRLA